MHGSVAWAPNCPAGQVAPLNAQRFILPLVLLERTTASCVHLVVNAADTTVSNAAALRLARAAGCVIIRLKRGGLYFAVQLPRWGRLREIHWLHGRR